VVKCWERWQRPKTHLCKIYVVEDGRIKSIPRRSPVCPGGGPRGLSWNNFRASLVHCSFREKQLPCCLAVHWWGSLLSWGALWGIDLNCKYSCPSNTYLNVLLKCYAGQGLNFVVISFIFGGIGFELRASEHLLGRCSAAWALFCIGYFRDRISSTIWLVLASNHDPPDLCLLSS
jgi:hypothetical protein